MDKLSNYLNKRAKVLQAKGKSKEYMSYSLAADRARITDHEYAMDAAVQEWFRNLPENNQPIKPVTALYELPIFESCWVGDARDLKA